MNIILLTAIIFTVSLVHGGSATFSYGSNIIGQRGASPYMLEPCQRRSSKGRYTTFVRRHTFQRNFNRNSKKAWQRYLHDFRLCGRTKVQSFIDAPRGQIDQICSHAGWRVRGATGSKGNLCISDQPMMIYDVESNKRRGCKVTNVNAVHRRVIVACDKIPTVNRCLPVHYERYRHQQPDNRQCM